MSNRGASARLWEEVDDGKEGEEMEEGFAKARNFGWWWVVVSSVETGMAGSQGIFTVNKGMVGEKPGAAEGATNGPDDVGFVDPSQKFIMCDACVRVVFIVTHFFGGNRDERGGTPPTRAPVLNNGVPYKT